MKIVKFHAENVKRLKAVDITPEGNTVVISGKNAQGKTSVLDAIWMALCGGSATKETVKPIREGQKKAVVCLDLGDLIVTRTWTSDENSYLKVEGKDGAQYKSPQTMLDKLVGNISFDPLAFTRLKPTEQRDVLLKLSGIEFQPDKWEQERKALFDARTAVNRELRDLEGQIKLLPEVPSNTPDSEGSVAAVMAELREAQKQKSANDAQRERFNALLQEAPRGKSQIETQKRQIATCTEDIEHLRDAHKAELETIQARQKQELSRAQDQMKHQGEELMGMELALESIVKAGQKMRVEVETLVDPDLTVYETRTIEIEETNKLVRSKSHQKTLLSQKAAKQAKADKLTADIAQMDLDKEQKLRQASFPVKGLGFDNDGVTYNGIPFGQCGAAERLTVSLAMAMATSPKLRVIRILDGSLLDAENMVAIQAMAKDQDYQVWIEVVDDTGKLGVYIEDGAVKE